MKHIRGFSLVEAMIGMVILAVILAGAMSFFMLWSSRSAESFRYKNADETVATALNMITADIRQAGFGVTANPEYAVFVVDKGTTTADELYVNCGDFLNFEGDIRAPTSHPESVAYRSINSVFKKNRTFTVSGNSLAYQALFTLATNANFTLFGIPTVPSATRYPYIGAVIASAGTIAADVNINGTSHTDHLDGSGNPTGIQDWTFPLVSPGRNATGGSAPLTAGMVVAPAISYKLIAGTGGGTGALWRNRGSSAAPYGTALLGGNPYIDVTNFQVRCEFKIGSASSWDVTNSSPANLRVVEVTLEYRVMISKSYKVNTTTKIYGWGPKVQRQLIVSPRSVAISAQM